jgi:hypothetical protein
MSVIGLGLLSFLSVIFSGVGTKYLPDDLSVFFKKNDMEQAQTVKSDINLQGKVPYLEKLPVLDNNLFIEQNYTELVFGGVNFKRVKFAVRTNEGVEAKISKLDSSSLSLPIFDMPYLEFEYKGVFYILEIIKEYTGTSKLIEFSYKINSIVAPSMDLLSFREHKAYNKPIKQD